MPLYSLNGRKPTLPPEGFYWIAPNASVIGDVVVGLDVGIWFGAVLRGDNEPIDIGARTNIQEFLHPAYRHGIAARHRRGVHDRP